MSALLCIWVLNAIDELHLNSYAEQLFHSSNYKHGNISFLMKITFNNDNHAIILDINWKTLAKGCLNWTLNAHVLHVSQVLNSIECQTSFTNPLNASMFVSGSVEDCCSILTFILFLSWKKHWISIRRFGIEFPYHLLFIYVMCSFCDRIFFKFYLCSYNLSRTPI